MARFNIDMARISNRMALVATVTFVMLVGLIATVLLVLTRLDSGGAGLAQGSPSDEPDVETPVTPPVAGAWSADRHDIDFRRDRLYGSLGLDTITPIYRPEYSLANEAPVHDETFVIGVAIDGEARAYPVSILNRHEMVNDVVSGVPLLVTW